jgi:DNA-binding FrmR family transcriptional regulator
MQHAHHANREKVLLNYRKTMGLIGKLISMTEENAYCIDLMKQNLAAIGLLRSAQEMLMEDHLNSCFLSAMESGNGKKKQEMIDEILTVTRLKK